MGFIAEIELLKCLPNLLILFESEIKYNAFFLEILSTNLKFTISLIIMLNPSQIDDSYASAYEEHLREKSLEQLLSKKLTPAPKLSLPHQGLFQNK